FFFQAEDGIRDRNVTGVQTCALPIFVVGKTCKDVTREQAGDYIFGYTCANDVSNRDLQLKDGQFARAKSFDTYKPLGPWIATGQIGRASCRESVQSSGGDRGLNKARE